MMTTTTETPTFTTRSHPPGDALAQALRGLPGHYDRQGERAAFAGLQRQLQALSASWDAADQDGKRRMRESLAGAPIAMLCESEMFRHCYEKPRGYAGDYQAMLIIWRGRTRPFEYRYRGQGRRGQLINALCLDLANSVANEERVSILQRHLLAHAGGRIASVGSGPMLEASEALAAGCSRDTRFDLYDQDAGALSFATGSLAPFDVRVEAHPGNVTKTLLREPKHADYDLLYSAGLYDYFKVPSAQRLTQHLWQRVRAGGSLLITNAHPDNPSRAFMEMAADWPLEHKSEAQMHSLTAGLPNLAEVELERDSQGVYQYLLAKKATGAVR